MEREKGNKEIDYSVAISDSREISTVHEREKRKKESKRERCMCVRVCERE